MKKILTILVLTAAISYGTTFTLGKVKVQYLTQSELDVTVLDTNEVISVIDDNYRVYIGDGVTTGGIPVTARGTDEYLFSGATNAAAYSIAMGDDANVAMQQSVAIGRAAKAYNTFSIAMGDSAVSSNQNAIAIGAGTYVPGSGSVVIGSSAKAYGSSGVALGQYAISSNSYSVAIGSTGVQALGIRSIAIGIGTEATGSSAIAMGRNAKSMNTYSIAMLGTASNVQSVAIGSGAVAGADYAVQIGDGENLNAGSLQFKDYTIADTNGFIPPERFAYALDTIDELNEVLTNATLRPYTDRTYVFGNGDDVAITALFDAQFYDVSRLTGTDPVHVFIKEGAALGQLDIFAAKPATYVIGLPEGSMMSTLLNGDPYIVSGMATITNASVGANYETAETNEILQIENIHFAGNTSIGNGANGYSGALVFKNSVFDNIAYLLTLPEHAGKYHFDSCWFKGGTIAAGSTSSDVYITFNNCVFDGTSELAGFSIGAAGTEKVQIEINGAWVDYSGRFLSDGGYTKGGGTFTLNDVVFKQAPSEIFMGKAGYVQVVAKNCDFTEAAASTGWGMNSTSEFWYCKGIPPAVITKGCKVVGCTDPSGVPIPDSIETRDTLITGETVVTTNDINTLAELDSIVADTSLATRLGLADTALQPALPIKITSTNYVVGTDNALEAYGGVIHVSANNLTITAPAVVSGMSFMVDHIAGATNCTVDVQAGEMMWLNNAAADAGEAAVAGANGLALSLTYAGSTNWSAVGTSWVQETP